MASRILYVGLAFLLFMSCVNHDISKKFNCEKSDLTLALDSISSATSCSVADGIIYVSAHGGNEPYALSLNNRPVQSLNSFTGLSSGIYSVSVMDRNGCKASLANIAVLANGFKFSAVVIQDTQCQGDNGSITIQVQQGSGPFTYKLNQGDFSTNNTFTGLASGLYTVVIQDVNLCTIQLNITVPRGNTGILWSSDILPIMKKSCAINGCHNGNNLSDYRLYANVKKDLLKVKSTTKSKTMPFDGTPLPQIQIDQIGCWVDDGGLDN